jgi:hypothetical protein
LLTRYSHYTASTVCTHRRAGARGATGTDGGTPHPGAPGSWSLRERPEPSTDSDQHSRGQAVPGGRAEPDRPWSTPGQPFPWRHAARRTVRLAAHGPRVVAGLWTGLLASPSLRVGRQGHGAWADPDGQPTAESPVVPPEPGCDQQRCRSRSGPVRGPAESVVSRAQPVDTGVEHVRPPIHRLTLGQRGHPLGGSGGRALRRRRFRVRPGVDCMGRT